LDHYNRVLNIIPDSRHRLNVIAQKGIMDITNQQTEKHEYCQRFDSVTVLAFDEDDNLLLTQEFRAAKEKYIWFLPTGKIDPGESPLQAAQREMQEEIGKVMG